MAFALLLAPWAEVKGSVSKQYRLYRDIHPHQSEAAHAGLNLAFSGDLADADSAFLVLSDWERQQEALPLASLMRVATQVLALQNGDAASEEEEHRWRRVVADAAAEAEARGRRILEADEDHATVLLIIGGVRGFLATLKIPTHPTDALMDGFKALKHLEKALDLDARLKDAYLGVGIFHATAANAPLVVRATLKMLGRSANGQAGLEALRRSAYEGQYTSVASQLFLIQFLSPYIDELRREKSRIFASLQATYPSSPRYAFWEADEILCFYPDSFFTPENTRRWQRSMRRAELHHPSERRYLELLKRQYALADTAPPPYAQPDTAFDLGEFGYYPGFLEAVAFRRGLRISGQPIGKAERKAMAAQAKAVLQSLKSHHENSSRYRYREWRIRDAFRLDLLRQPVMPTPVLTESESQADSADPASSPRAPSVPASFGPRRKPVVYPLWPDSLKASPAADSARRPDTP